MNGHQLKPDKTVKVPEYERCEPEVPDPIFALCPALLIAGTAFLVGLGIISFFGGVWP